MQTVALFFGGPSNEHEVSILSAKNIIQNFPLDKFCLKLIYWDKSGNFYLVKNIEALEDQKEKIVLEDFKNLFDIAFPITHGKYGEDGVLQSLFASQKIKYCGCHVLSSALCMDKVLFKQLVEKNNIKQVDFLSIDYNLDREEVRERKIAEIKERFVLPFFIKPANSGSSVGITKVSDYENVSKAIELALKHDSKIIVEEGLACPREIEVAVLGNTDLKISEPGELILAKDFYDYDDKYKLDNTGFSIPAILREEDTEKIKEIAASVYKLMNCSGFARIDFFVYDNEIYLNEINTLPGFTSISMYPMLMQKTGMTYTEIIEEIINLSY